MNQDDWAIVVGIRYYPGLSHLGGPENDALAFHSWLVDPNGGAVPHSNAALIQSSQFHSEPPASVINARPTMREIENAFDFLAEISEHRSESDNGPRIGRRLYLYFAGHGFSPRQDNAAMAATDPALLTANATRKRPNYHIPSPSYANWFLKAGCFDEILLFMDCCRDDYPHVARNSIYPDVTHPNAKSARLMTAYATQWNGKSREKLLTTGDGKVHGIFTATLLTGLKGAASTQSGDITDESLGRYLIDNMKNYLTQNEQDDSQIPKTPEVYFHPHQERRIVINRVPPLAIPGPQVFPVRIHFDPGDIGKTVSVNDGEFRPVQRIKIDQNTCILSLPRGLYNCEIVADGREVQFSVKGTGGVDVKL